MRWAIHSSERISEIAKSLTQRQELMAKAGGEDWGGLGEKSAVQCSNMYAQPREAQIRKRECASALKLYDDAHFANCSGED